MDLKEPCALYILFAASRRGGQGQRSLCLGFGTLLLLSPVLGGWITDACVVKTTA